MFDVTTGYQERKTAVSRLIMAKLRRPLTNDAPGSDAVMEVLQMKAAPAPSRRVTPRRAMQGRPDDSSPHSSADGMLWAMLCSRQHAQHDAMYRWLVSSTGSFIGMPHARLLLC